MTGAATDRLPFREFHVVNHRNKHIHCYVGRGIVKAINGSELIEVPSDSDLDRFPGYRQHYDQLGIGQEGVGCCADVEFDKRMLRRGGL